MTTRRAIVGWAVALVGPLTVVTAYLLLSRAQTWSTDLDWVALAVALAVGVAGLRMARCAAVVGSMVYVCVAAFVLLWYSLSFVCSVFGDCL